MNRNLNISKESSAHEAGRHPLPRWRMVFVSLMLVFIIGSVGQTPLVQAAPAHVPVKVYMQLVNPKTTVCVGKEANYQVRVSTPPTTIVGIDVGAYALSGIKVEAFSQDTSVGDFVYTKNGFSSATTGTSDEVVDLDNPNAEPGPHTAYFTFKAKKAGKTTLYFEGLAHGQYVSDKVLVNVINCKYKVIIGSQMFWSGAYGSIKFRGVSTEGQIKADETGYIFTGTASVYWVSTSAVPNCSAANSLGISKVNMRGNLNDSGQLLLELKYDPVAFTDVVTCPKGSGSSSFPITPSSLKVSVPYFGGVVQLSQQMDGGPEPALGSANVYVIPLDGAK